MFWWHHAAELVRDKKAQQFGFITTNSIHQTFNRRCLESFLNNGKKPVTLAFAIPDHPWIDSVDGAAVSISMTVGKEGSNLGQLYKIDHAEEFSDGEYAVHGNSKVGLITPSLSIGVNYSSARSLLANSRLSCLGYILGGRGFVLEKSEAESMGRNEDKSIIHPISNGNDLVNKPRGLWVLDTHGLCENQLRETFPKAWQHLYDSVFPERRNNRDPKLSTYWWLFRRANSEYRNLIPNLKKYFVTPETSKYRTFFAIEQEARVEHGVVVIGLSDFYYHGTMSSHIHRVWSLAQGGLLGPTPRYNKTRCFETFPFPDLPEGELKTRIRDLGERLDAHRKARQAEHPDLTLTGIYNVLEKLRKAEPLTDKDKEIHDKALVTLLKQIHDDLDEAVLEAYGWLPNRSRGSQPLSANEPRPSNASSSTDNSEPTSSPKKQRLRASATSSQLPLADRLARGDEALEQVLLQRLVDLNHERAAEEAQGHIRYLRPEFQDPDHGKKAAQNQQTKLGLQQDTPAVPLPAEKLPWPKSTVARVATLKQLLQTLPPDPEILSPALKANNTPKRRAEIQDLLDTLQSLGHLAY